MKLFQFSNYIPKVFQFSLSRSARLRPMNIFTDGDESQQSNNCTASAVCIPYFDVQISRKIPDLCSVYTAELIALLLA